MSKKRSLRSITSEVPEPEAANELLINLHRQGDREAAIVGASLVESDLQNILIRSFRQTADGLESSLFENRGPLSDFNSKILIAQAFGVISTNIAGDLQRIRKIRNCFAHARMDVRFTEPLVAKEVFELAAAMAVQNTMDQYPESYGGQRPYDDPKTSFGLSCYIVHFLLCSEHFPSAMNVELELSRNGDDLA